MNNFFKKILPVLIFWGVFGYVIFYIPYPQTITQATLSHLLIFLISLFLVFSFTLNLFLANLFLSSSFALGIIFMLILQALDALNLVTAILTLITVGLLISYFRKAKNKGLTMSTKIPKLTHLRRKK